MQGHAAPIIAELEGSTICIDYKARLGLQTVLGGARRDVKTTRGGRGWRWRWPQVV